MTIKNITSRIMQNIGKEVIATKMSGIAYKCKATIRNNTIGILENNTFTPAHALLRVDIIKN